MALDLPPLARRGLSIGLLLSLVGIPLSADRVLRLREGPAPAPARRVVSLVPAVTEMIYAIGGGDRVVGVSSFDSFPAEVQRVTRVGGLLDPDLERIFALRPDLVVIYASQDDLRKQLERVNIRVFEYSHAGLPQVLSVIESVGGELGLANRAASTIAEMRRRLDAVRRQVEGLPRPRTLLVFGRERGALRAVYASGGRGFLHDLLELAGGVDVLEHVDRENVQASTELILGLAPEAIVEIHGGETLSAAEADRERRVWDGLPGLPAVQRGRVHILSGQELVVPGPRVVIAAERLARALHPGAFPN
jgi:iron complex transport system substrate-binding protein